MQKAAMPSELDEKNISTLLRAWSDGDQSALDGLTPIVYDELRRLAHRYMKRERPGHTLQTTALVNDVYMRLVEYKRMKWQNRAHFFAVSAQVMRRILVDHARRHNVKRGTGVPHVSLEEVAVAGGDRPADLVALDERLECVGPYRSTESTNPRDALFGRTQCGGHGRSAQRFARYREARLEHRQVLAIP
jgi:RNA polymerase sigma factor (TIGR02999 family)